MTGRRRIAVIAVVGLASAVALHWAGSGSLAPPPVGSWAALEAWYVGRGPAAVVALVRLAGFGAGCWLAVTAVLQLVAPLVADRRFSTLVDAFSPRFLRALTTSAAGLSITAGLTLPGTPVSELDDPPGTAVMVPLDVPPTSSSTTETTAPTTTTTVVTAAPPATPVSVPVDPAPAVAREGVVVAPGDSFWSIAVEEAGERELLEYWRALIDLNRDRLVDPSNPDLLYSDQVLRLP